MRYLALIAIFLFLIQPLSASDSSCTKNFTLLSISFFNNIASHAPKNTSSEGTNSADSIATIEIDFENRTAPDLEEVKDLEPGQFYRIKIKGINLNLWDISIGNKDTTFSRALRTPVFESEILGVIKQLGEMMNRTTPPGDTPSPLQNLNAKIAPQSITGYTNDAQADTNLLNTQKILINNLRDTIVNFDERIQQTLLGISISVLDQLTEESLCNNGENCISLVEANAAFSEHRKEFSGLVELSRTVREGFKNLVKEHPPRVKSDTTRYKDMESNIKTLESNLGLLSNQLSADNIDKALRKLAFLNNKNEYISLPLQFTQESATVDINFTPRDKKYGLSPQSMTFMFPPPERQRFSIGLAFYSSGLRDKRYSVTQVSNEEVRFTKDRSRYHIGVATLMRYEFIQNKSRSPGFFGTLTFGPGISMTDSVRPNLLIGGGIGYGNKHAIVLDIGAITGKVDRRRKSFSTEQVYPIGTSFTTSTLKFNVFASIGYLFRL